MDEAKAAAYYDELTRKGEGAARFKQGLGFSSASSNRDDDVPARGSALSSSSSSFLSSFVRASSPTKAAEFQKQAQLEAIQNKLKKNSPIAFETLQSSRVSRDIDRHSRRRSRSRSQDRRGSSHRRRSSSRERGRERYGEKGRDRERRVKRRSTSRSVSDEERRRRSDRRREKSSGGDRSKDKGVGKVGKERNAAIDHAKLIEGYDKMSASERVKAKMKFQLSQTAEKDAIKGMGSGWERFEFNKDAPLDDDEEIEAAEDDAALVERMGHSFRFSAVEARREEQIRDAHDAAIFGASSIAPSCNTEDQIEQNGKSECNENALATSLISDKVITKQQGSWRDRARKL
ncbi:hypothetical protein U1Q18_027481 [Sarracenia purpurea var. burkii]